MAAAKDLSGFNRKNYSLAKKSVNKAGYDSRGAYYGAGGQSLYVAEYKPDDRIVEFRAKDKAAAEAVLRDWCRHGHPRTLWWM